MISRIYLPFHRERERERERERWGAISAESRICLPLTNSFWGFKLISGAVGVLLRSENMVYVWKFLEFLMECYPNGCLYMKLGI
jgi:hypothetical protein